MGITTREFGPYAKGSRLTTAEMDENFNYLDKGVLAGTAYVYVAGNGTPEENAAELQAAYELATVKVDYKTENLPYVPQDWWFQNGKLTLNYGSYYFDGNGYGPIEFGVTYEMLFDGVSYFGIKMGTFSDWVFTNDINPPVNSTTLEILIPTITYYLVTVVVAPGKYSFDTDFVVDKEHVSIASLTGNADVLFTGNGTINVTVNDILIRGIDVQDKAFIVDTLLDLLIIEKCKGGEYSFGAPTGLTTSTFIDCVGTKNCFSFGFGSGTVAAGTYVNCVSGLQSFGSNGGTASGTFINCVSYNLDQNNFASSFGKNGIASGIFTNCTSGGTSFGSNGTASGTFTNCIAEDYSFGEGSFGQGGTASGQFDNCTGKFQCFGKTASGKFTNCKAEGQSFGYQGTTSGSFTNCIAGIYSFGGPFTLTGKLYYCRLTQGTFSTSSAGGRTYYCVDGNGNTNNQ